MRIRPSNPHRRSRYAGVRRYDGHSFHVILIHEGIEYSLGSGIPEVLAARLWDAAADYLGKPGHRNLPDRPLELMPHVRDYIDRRRTQKAPPAQEG